MARETIRVINDRRRFRTPKEEGIDGPESLGATGH
jgi:hypothetical protein